MPITNGAGSAASVNDTLYVQAQRGAGNIPTFLAIAPTGKQVWAAPVEVGDGSVPSIANGTIYLVGANGVTVSAIAATNGHIRWQRTTTTGCPSNYAPNYVPPLQGNVVVVNNDCNAQTFAFRASDGAPLWRSQTQMDAVLDGVGYGVEENSGSTTTTHFDAVRLSDGAVLWQVPLP